MLQPIIRLVDIDFVTLREFKFYDIDYWGIGSATEFRITMLLIDKDMRVVRNLSRIVGKWKCNGNSESLSCGPEGNASAYRIQTIFRFKDSELHNPWNHRVLTEECYLLVSGSWRSYATAPYGCQARGERCCLNMYEAAAIPIPGDGTWIAIPFHTLCLSLWEDEPDPRIDTFAVRDRLYRIHPVLTTDEKKKRDWVNGQEIKKRSDALGAVSEGDYRYIYAHRRHIPEEYRGRAKLVFSVKNGGVMSMFWDNSEDDWRKFQERPNGEPGDYQARLVTRVR